MHAKQVSAKLLVPSFECLNCQRYSETDVSPTYIGYVTFYWNANGQQKTDRMATGGVNMFLGICVAVVIFASVCGVCELTVKIVRKLRS